MPHGAFSYRWLEFCRILTKGRSNMRKYYAKILKSFFHDKLFYTREALGITQEEMAHRLSMAARTYVDLDHGKTSCSALTLALFLIYVCTDSAAFLEELRDAFETTDNKAA